jgi:hypothetical protein
LALAILTRIDKLRSALSGRYWIYAVGEILLIAAGIMMALQINSWNNTREDRKEERAYLERLTIQMSKNEDELAELGHFFQSRMKAVNFALSSLDKDPENTDVNGFSESIGETLSLRLISIQTDVYEELVSTGKLNLISSADLREALARHFASVEAMNKVDRIGTNDFFHNDYVPFLLEHMNMQEVFDGWRADWMKGMHRRKLVDLAFFKLQPDHPLKLQLGNNLTYMYSSLVWMESQRLLFLEQIETIRMLIKEEAAIT